MIARIAKRSAAFFAGIFVGAILAQVPTLARALINLSAAYLSHPTPERVAFSLALFAVAFATRHWFARRGVRMAMVP